MGKSLYVQQLREYFAELDQPVLYINLKDRESTMEQIKAYLNINQRDLLREAIALQNLDG